MRLGKRPPRYDPRTLYLPLYLDRTHLAPVPPSVDWTARVTVPWGVDLNDRIGDCTCAAAAHLVMVTTANASSVVVPTDGEVLAMYEAIGGYRPGHPATDRGATELDALKYLRATGLAGQRLDAYADVHVADVDNVKRTIAWFGTAYIGVQLPRSAVDGFGRGAWSNTADTDIVGGHALVLVAYDAAGPTCVTWGALQKMTWAWFQRYADEVHAPLMFDWIDRRGLSPSNLRLADLQQDLRMVS